MKRLSCLPLSSSALRQPIWGELAIAAVLMGKRINPRGNHRPDPEAFSSWVAPVPGVTRYFIAQFFLTQFLLAEFGQLIRDQIISPIQSGRYRGTLC